MNSNLALLGSQLGEILEKLVKDAVAEALKRNAEESPRYPEKVNVEQASEITHFTKNSLYQMHSRGQIPGAIKVGGKLLFDTAALQEWMRNNGRVA